MTETPTTPLVRFRELVFGDRSLQSDLAEVEETRAFAARAVETARRRGLDLTEEDLGGVFGNDPLGVRRFTDRPGAPPPAPQPGWLPIQVSQTHQGPAVDWAYFGDRKLRESFYEDSVRIALRLPFNRLFGFRTGLDDLARWSQALPHLRPNGFIFHMSRCGSTLAAQMLAAAPANIVISEPAPIDAIVQLDRQYPALDSQIHVDLLRAMTGVFGHVRNADESRYFIKLDCWHTLALPLFRRAFPDTPWVFLYRDPAEVMVSQIRQRGVQTVPQFVPPSLYGLELGAGAPDEDYCAQVLGAVCEGALKEYPRGGGLLVNYRQLPEALWATILPHFGVTCSEAEHTTMAAAARYDAKAPGFDFAPDSAAKQQAATETIRAASERHLSEVYQRLEAARQG